jgi:hypothetical protein
VALEPPIEPIEGDSHAHLLGRLEPLADELDVSVAFAPLPGEANGYWAPARRSVVVEQPLPSNAQLATLVHELAHALRQLDRQDGDPALSYAEEELVVEGDLPRPARGLKRSASDRTSTPRERSDAAAHRVPADAPGCPGPITRAVAGDAHRRSAACRRFQRSAAAGGGRDAAAQYPDRQPQRVAAGAGRGRVGGRFAYPAVAGRSAGRRSAQARQASAAVQATVRTAFQVFQGSS